MKDVNFYMLLVTAIYVTITAIMAWHMYRQTHLQKQAATLQKRASDSQFFYFIVARMEQTRRDRATIREYVKAGAIECPPPEPVRGAVDRVCREFDLLGLLDRNGLVDSRLVDQFYSVPFVLLYEEIIGKYVEYLREQAQRGPTHFWELVQFYGRVRWVPSNHPGLSDLPDWPDDPRAKPKHAA